MGEIDRDRSLHAASCPWAAVTTLATAALERAPVTVGARRSTRVTRTTVGGRIAHAPATQAAEGSCASSHPSAHAPVTLVLCHRPEAQASHCRFPATYCP